MRVHFVCRGNVYRSTLAEAYFNSLELKNAKAISSGTVADVDRENNKPLVPMRIAFLEQHGLGKYTKRSADQLTQERVSPDDITICMNQRAYDEANQIVSLPKDTIVWNINDAREEIHSPLTEELLLKHADHTFKLIKQKVDELVRSRLGVL